jgi:MFS family permease
MSTVAALPFFLFTLPAGALADMVDRKKLLLIMNLWLAGSAGFLAFLGFFGLLNPYVILVVKHFIPVDKELLGGKRPEPCPLHKLATTTPFSLRTSLSAKISKAKDFFFVPTIT